MVAYSRASSSSAKASKPLTSAGPDASSSFAKASNESPSFVKAPSAEAASDDSSPDNSLGR